MIATTVASQRPWNGGSFSSRSTGPKTCMPPRSWTPSIPPPAERLLRLFFSIGSASPEILEQRRLGTRPVGTSRAYTVTEDRTSRGPSAREERMNQRIAASAVMATLVAGLCLTGCERGPMQKAGEKVDEGPGKNKLIGKGPAEKAGRKVDNTVNDIKK